MAGFTFHFVFISYFDITIARRLILILCLWPLKYTAHVLRNSLLKVLVQFASDSNHIPYSVLPNYWRKRFSVTLQFFSSSLITQAYLLLVDKGGENLERDFSAFEMYG